MTDKLDPEFSMLIGATEAYDLQMNGEAERGSNGPDVGAFGILKRAKRTARGAGRLAKRTHRLALKASPHALAIASTKLAARGLAAATGPIRRRIFRAFFSKLISRRARLLAWRARRSLNPTRQEASSARGWAVRYIKGKGLLGKLVGTALGGDGIGEAATTALVTASIPVLIQLARKALRSAERQGAPADPRETPSAPSDDGGQEE